MGWRGVTALLWRLVMQPNGSELNGRMRLNEAQITFTSDVTSSGTIARDRGRTYELLAVAVTRWCVLVAFRVGKARLVGLQTRPFQSQAMLTKMRRRRAVAEAGCRPPSLFIEIIRISRNMRSAVSYPIRPRRSAPCACFRNSGASSCAVSTQLVASPRVNETERHPCSSSNDRSGQTEGSTRSIC